MFHVKVAEEVAGADTVSVTGTVCGVLVAPPVAVNVIIALYVPAVSPDVFTVTEIGSVSVVVVPEAWLKVNQAALSAINQVKVSAPPLVIFTDLATGLPAPCIAVNDKLAGLSPIVGLGAAVTVKLTGTVRGVFDAPVAAIVIVPV